MLALLLGLAVALVTAVTRADEDEDHGIAPVAALRTVELSAPTPREVPGASTIRTSQLREWMRSEPKPLLFDVLGGEAHDSLPGAIWLHLKMSTAHFPRRPKSFCRNLFAAFWIAF